MFSNANTTPAPPSTGITSPTGNQYDVSLQPASYKGVGFPISFIEKVMSQDMAKHKRLNVDGSINEGTGRQSWVFNISAPMINGLSSEGSDWQSSNLFPDQFTALMAALDNNVVGTFIHPIYGSIQCKPLGYHTKTDALLRNGQIIEFSLIEQSVVSTASSTSTLEFGTGLQAAGALDAEDLLIADPISTTLMQYGPDVPLNSQDGMPSIPMYVQGIPTSSISDLMSSIQVNITAPTTNSQVIGNNIDQLNFQLDGMENYLNNSDDISLQTNLYLVERVRSTINNENIYLQQSKTQLLTYIVAAQMTIGRLSVLLQNTVDQLSALNPQIGNSLLVDVGTVITYQTPSTQAQQQV